MLLLPIKMALRLLLSAILLFPGGGVFELRHAHEGGDRPHDHHAIALAKHSSTEQLPGQTSHVECNPHRDAECSACCEIEDCVDHVHVYCFGFRFTRTLPVDSSGHPRDSGHGVATEYLQLLAESDVAASSCSHAKGLSSEFVVAAQAYAVAVGDLDEHAFPLNTAKISLCDAARAARCGVLLI